MSGEPDDPPFDDGGLSIDIDPELIAAAMSAVESRSRKRKKPSFAPSRLQEETGDPVTVDLENPLPVVVAPSPRSAAPVEQAPPSPPVGPHAVDVQLLNLRLRDAQDRLRRAEAENAGMAAERAALDKQVRELRETVQRQALEADAVRVRNRKEREEVERSVEERVLRAFFEVGDNVERGIAHAGQDPQRVAQGLLMINEQFHGLLRRLGVERIDASRGALFDPAQHEAILHTPSESVLPGCILDQVTSGFVFRGRMLRPARVVVASGGDAKE